MAKTTISPNPSKSPAVATHADAPSVAGPQGQRLIPLITHASVGAEHISAGLVVMPPAKNSKPHFHRSNEMLVIVIEGWAATLMGPDMEPYYHGPGEFLYIPEGVIHTAVNLSTTDRLIAVEVRTDPHFNDDVILMPELEPAATLRAQDLHRQFAAGTLATPARWQGQDISFNFRDTAAPAPAAAIPTSPAKA